MNSGFKFALITIFFTILIGCAPKEMPPPACRVKANVVSNYQGPGACIVRLNNKLMVTKLNNGLYDLPIGGKLSYTIENSDPQSTTTASNTSLSTQVINDSAQCAAHEAMWEQTGFNVQVGLVLAVQNDGTWLFACDLDAGFDGSEPPFDAPEWSSNTIDKIAFIDPFAIEMSNWSQPEHFTVMRNAFVAKRDK